MKKRILSLLAALCLVVGLIPGAAAAEVTSGTCGENLTWVLTADGTLTISGEGEMESNLSPAPPWSAYQYDIISVVVYEGVTSISYGAFGLFMYQNPEDGTHTEIKGYPSLSSISLLSHGFPAP